MTKEEILETWEELKTTVESMELDVVKCSNGVKAGGRRSRAGLKLLKDLTQKLRKQTLAMDKGE